MKISIRLLAVLLILLVPVLGYSQNADALSGNYVVQGDYIKGNCSCQCRGKSLNSSAIYKKGTETRAVMNILLGPIIAGIGGWALDLVEGQLALYRCHDVCARSCGGYTECAYQTDADCKGCCTTYCATDYGGPLKTACETSCGSTCAYLGIIKGLTDLIYQIAGVIGALMILIHTIRMITADNPEDRNAAKNSIIHVILALFIIALAGIVASIFLRPDMIPTI